MQPKIPKRRSKAGLPRKSVVKHCSYTLNDLLAGITKENLHEEISSGPDREKEKSSDDANAGLVRVATT